MEELIKEIREDFRIPPYYPDTAIERQVNEGAARLLTLNPGRDYDTDIIFRNLLKTYAYYAFMNATNDFFENYNSSILEWQLESEVQEDE
jgi:hypothetical protein